MRTKSLLNQRAIVAELLGAIREEAGLTQSELSKKLRRPQSFVSKYESATRRVDLVELVLICKGIGIDPKSFMRRFQEALASR